MNKKSLPILILILIVIVCIAILVKSLATPAETQVSTTYSIVETPAASTPATIYTDKLIVTAIRAPGGIITAEIASSSDQQAKGLGGRASLQANAGMLFPFKYPGDYGFWMKDMRFSIDMVWISSNKKVVSITPGVSPDTYPNVFYPPLAISYVLELNAGDAQRFGIATGTQLVF